jgi:Tfp pilus assembly protein PilO
MNKRTITYTILSCAIFLWIFCSFIFILHSIGNLEKSALALMKTAAADRNKEAALFSDAAVASDATRSSNQIENFFPTSATVASFVELVEKTGLANGVTVSISSISTSPTRMVPLLSLSFNISATGSWSNLVAFTSVIESLPYDIVLTGVSFLKDGTDPKGNWNLQAGALSFVSN